MLPISLFYLVAVAALFNGLPILTAPALAAPSNTLEEARRQAQHGAHLRAIPLFEAVIKADSGSTAVYAELVQSLLKTDQPLKALELCQQGLQRDSTAVALFHAQAAAYALQGRYALAIKALEHQIELSPASALAHLNLGGLHTKLGQYPQAETHLRRAGHLAAEDGIVRRRLGELFLLTQRPDSAATAFNTALARDQDNETLHFLYGKALESSGARTEALAAYIEARRRDPGFAQAHYRTATLAKRLGRQALADSAQTAYRRLESLGQDQPTVGQRYKELRAAVLDAPEEEVHHFNLALFFLRHNYQNEAYNRLARAVQLNPRQYRALNRMGSILLKRQRPSEALGLFLAALRLAPDFYPAHLNAGNANMIIGRPDRASGHYRQVTKGNPGMTVAWQLLVRAYLAQGNIEAAEQALKQGFGGPAAADMQIYEKLSREIARRKTQSD
jgi:tetratricopeptide (TPR) repeat protein